MALICDPSVGEERTRRFLGPASSQPSLVRVPWAKERSLLQKNTVAAPEEMTPKIELWPPRVACIHTHVRAGWKGWFPKDDSGFDVQAMSFLWSARVYDDWICLVSFQVLAVPGEGRAAPSFKRRRCVLKPRPELPLPQWELLADPLDTTDGFTKGLHWETEAELCPCSWHLPLSSQFLWNQCLLLRWTVLLLPALPPLISWEMVPGSLAPLLHLKVRLTFLSPFLLTGGNREQGKKMHSSPRF